MKHNHFFLVMLFVICLMIIPLSKTVHAVTTQAPFLFNLRLGSTGVDVQRLQKYLNDQGVVVASTGPGSSGNETQYYGPATARAVSRFQELHADAILSPLYLTKGTGNFYMATRSFVNQNLAQTPVVSATTVLQNNTDTIRKPFKSRSILIRKSASKKYTIGGNVSGLTDTVVLDASNGDSLTISSNGAFTFPTTITSGSSYSVSITSQPIGQMCNIVNSTGTNTLANITNVTVTCVTNTYTLGGTVSGLSGTVALLNNADDAITITDNGLFTFTTYSVTVLTQPAGQTCIVTNGSGAIVGSNITNIDITCTTNTYAVGGAFSGLSGTVVLQNNGGDDITITNNGLFTFATPVAEGSSYDVTVLTQPVGQTCVVINGSGTIMGSDIVSVNVICVAD
jgi:peptidoglycan hydrolase-like protein with peptidoglycan-binding domain